MVGLSAQDVFLTSILDPGEESGGGTVTVVLGL